LARGIDAFFPQPYELVPPILNYFGREQAAMIPIALLSAIPNTPGEELGWRGFALPELLVKCPTIQSSITLGFLWGFLHIPFWIANGQMDLELAENFLSIIASAILFTRVYKKTPEVVCSWHGSFIGR
jgi:membrane protease YdiL (CAAX protease family)